MNVVNEACGFLLVDKPAGCSSHQALSPLKKIFNTGHIGHAGTLDPMATGLLVVAVGRATKLLRFLTDDGKEYEGSFVLGLRTSSNDITGEELSRCEAGTISLAQVQKAAEPFLGDILQIPPQISAIKVDGQRAYALARAGETVELAARPVTVRALSISGAGGASATFNFSVSTSSGFYVRSLVRDIGEALDVGATLTSLRRTKSGRFSLGGGKPLAEITSTDLKPWSELLLGWASARLLPDYECQALAAGIPGALPRIFADLRPLEVCIYGEKNSGLWYGVVSKLEDGSLVRILMTLES